jgi:dTDP-glucose pyrophosphorylase
LNNQITKAVIMARGLGTRMRQTDPAAALTTEQAKVAASGVKGMIPVGRPFMDFQLGALAETGYREICLVTGPEHESVREYYQRLPTRRIRISHSIQPEPRGTADAVAAAQDFAADDPFLVLNSDNYYPAAALRALGNLDGPGLAAFSVKALIEDSGIPSERVTSFPVVESGEDNILSHLKTSDKESGSGYASMNCWRFNSGIFQACRAISPSTRGELELPDAVQYSIDRLGVRYRVLRFEEGVLDMSSRADVKQVAKRLGQTEVNF